MAKVLLVDDDQNFVEATCNLLDLLGHQVDTAATVEQAKSLIELNAYDRILLDLMLPDGSGLHIFDMPKRNFDNLAVTIITGHPAVKGLVTSVYGPGVNYLIKPIDIEQLRALFISESDVEEDAENQKHFGCLVGESPKMQQLYEIIERVASRPANVMLMGESGVGKEVFANAIHRASGSGGPYVAANCGAFSRELIGSELFGHEKGAFTGAVARKQGLFEQANGGTLFLDEITEMPLDLQPNLLRVLELNVVTRLGGGAEIPVECRVISATNRTEADIVQEHRLREDLYFRLAVFPIKIPPLRERKEDIPLLVDHFLLELNKQYQTSLGIREESTQKLMNYDWPGNVRELRHALHRAFIMSDPSASALTLPENISSPFSQVNGQPSQSLQAGRTIEEVERELIQATLKELDGDKPRAAEMLGISLKTLYNRLNTYEKEEVAEKSSE